MLLWKPANTYYWSPLATGSACGSKYSRKKYRLTNPGSFRYIDDGKLVILFAREFFYLGYSPAQGPHWSEQIARSRFLQAAHYHRIISRYGVLDATSYTGTIPYEFYSPSPCRQLL
jgi:hypothetical protein